MLGQVAIERQLQLLLASMLRVLQFLPMSLPTEKRTEHSMVLIYSLHQQAQHGVCQTVGGPSRALPDYGSKNLFYQTSVLKDLKCLVLDGHES